MVVIMWTHGQLWLLLVLSILSACPSTNAVMRPRSLYDNARWRGRESPRLSAMARLNLTRLSSQNPHQIVNVYDFGAKGDGLTDDTAHIQAALDAVSAGGIVFAPAGRFLCKGQLNIPPAVTLEGTYRVVPSHTMGQNKDVPTDGTILLPVSGRGQENGTAFVTIQHDATLRGVVVYYMDQSNDTAPVPYPWSMDLVGSNAAVTDVECLNCWNAVRAVGAARHYIARVQGQPINIGVFVDENYDIGRVEDVHFNPWFSSHPQFVSWQLTHGRAFVFARTDWEYVLNTFAFAYAVGYHFIESSKGACNGNFLGIGADMAANASVLVDATQPMGIQITNGEFTSFLASSWGNTTAQSSQVVVNPSNKGAVRFVNSAFWGPSFQVARISSSATTGFDSCTFVNWDVKKKGLAAITNTGPGSLVVTGSEFMQAGKQVELGAATSRAIITSNLINGPLSLDTGGLKAPQLQVALNAVTK